MKTIQQRLWKSNANPSASHSDSHHVTGKSPKPALPPMTHCKRIRVSPPYPPRDTGIVTHKKKSPSPSPPPQTNTKGVSQKCSTLRPQTHRECHKNAAPPPLTREVLQKAPYGHSVSAFHKNGSIVISRAAQGRPSSNFVTTSGWRTPRVPIFWPRTKMSAQRPGKKVASVEGGRKK